MDTIKSVTMSIPHLSENLFLFQPPTPVYSNPLIIFCDFSAPLTYSNPAPSIIPYANTREYVFILTSSSNILSYTIALFEQFHKQSTILVQCNISISWLFFFGPPFFNFEPPPVTREHSFSFESIITRFHQNAQYQY